MENTKQEQKKHIVAQWVERTEENKTEGKDIILFDFISSHYHNLSNDDKNILIVELSYFIADLLRGYKSTQQDFINQLKEYRQDEFFSSDEE